MDHGPWTKNLTSPAWRDLWAWRLCEGVAGGAGSRPGGGPLKAFAPFRATGSSGGGAEWSGPPGPGRWPFRCLPGFPVRQGGLTDRGKGPGNYRVLLPGGPPAGQDPLGFWAGYSFPSARCDFPRGSLPNRSCLVCFGRLRCRLLRDAGPLVHRPRGPERVGVLPVFRLGPPPLRPVIPPGAGAGIFLPTHSCAGLDRFRGS
ncbi:hypothetical protein BH24BAC1_BH24BAC1_31470 [soil metagenome]